MASVCSIYDVDLKNLAAEHYLSMAEELSREVGLVLANLHFNVCRDRNEYHATNDFFGSNDMKNV